MILVFSNLLYSCYLAHSAGNLPVMWSRGPKPVGLSAGRVFLFIVGFFIVIHIGA